MTHLILSHGIAVKPEDLDFIPERSHTACRICGTVFQSRFDRLPLDQSNAETTLAGLLERQEWSRKHARTHPGHVHESLARSGRFATPEAMVKLAAYGITSITDLVFSDESEHAGREAPRCPVNDVETTLKGVSIAVR